MKGISLPINMIVIVAIAVLVLVVTAGYFGGAFIGSTGTIQFEQAFSQACTQLRNLYNCAATTQALTAVKVRYQPPGATIARDYSLANLCNQKLGTGSIETASNDIANCVASCGCPKPE